MQTATIYTKKQEYYMRRILLTIIGLGIFLHAEFTTAGQPSGVVKDTKTSLQWQNDYSDNGGNIKEAKWTDAIDYCEALSLGGHDDWRLPNFNELYSIADRSKRNPAIDTTVFENAVSDHYWSSSTVVGGENGAWDVGFYFGVGNLSYKSHSLYVRCVRAGQ
jgi:hypothetical protein